MKYVPPQKGLPSGSKNADSGHPPRPESCCTALMYTMSISGRSSRSSLMLTKLSFSRRAVSSFSKLSRSITWHQWQVE